MRLSFVESTDLDSSEIPSELTEYLWGLQELCVTIVALSSWLTN